MLELCNVEERHALKPSTFHIASRLERSNVPVGQFVKLIWEEVGSDQGERMWVIITERKSDGTYTGQIRNNPFVFADQLKFNDEVTFGPQHIADLCPPA